MTTLSAPVGTTAATGTAGLSAPRSAGRTAQRVATWAALFVLAFTLVAYALAAGHVLRFRFPIGYGEGPLLDQAVRIAHGSNIYVRIGPDAPWNVANYPPLLPAVQALFVKATGPAYWYGRALSVLGTLVAAAAAGRIVVHLTRDRVAGVVAAGALLTVPELDSWSMLGRVDGPALGLSLAGLAVVVARAGAARRWIVLGAVLMLLAVLTRQTFALAAPTAGATYLWWHHRRRLTTFLVALVGGGVSALALLVATTGGGFWFNVVTANVNEFQWARVARLAVPVVRDDAVALLTLGVLLVAGLRRRPRWWTLLAPYALASVVPAMCVGKVGSGSNYFFELGAAAAMSLGIALALLRDRPWGRAALLTALAAFVLATQVPAQVLGKAEARTSAAETQRADRLTAMVADTDGPVLADSQLGLEPLLGRPLTLQPFETTQLARAGQWDQAPLLTAIDDDRFGLVLLDRWMADPRDQVWTPQMRSHLRAAYRRVGLVGSVEIYRPR